MGFVTQSLPLYILFHCLCHWKWRCLVTPSHPQTASLLLSKQMSDFAHFVGLNYEYWADITGCSMLAK